MIIVYGIRNCDTVRRALKWLAGRDVPHQFHDFRKDGLERHLLENWTKELGIDILLNKRGTTWRKLSAEKKKYRTEQEAIDLLLAYPAMIKRPVFDFGDKRRIGFSNNDQEEIVAVLGGDIS